MNDLLDIDWAKQSSSSSSSSSSPSNNNGRPMQSNNMSRHSSTMSSAGMANGSTNAAQKSTSSSYNFDALTRSMPAMNTSRSGSSTPSTATKPVSQSAASGSNTDAFSSLLGFGSSSAASANATMSMADRLKQNGQTSGQYTYGSTTKPQTQKQPPSSFSSGGANDDAAWAGLEDFMGPASKPTAKAKTQTPSASQAKANSNTSPWDLAFDAAPAKPQIRQGQQAQTVKTKPVSKDPFDFSEFEDPGDLQSSAFSSSNTESAPQQPTQRTAAPERAAKRDFINHNDADDDVLGQLGRPARPLASAYEDASFDDEPVRTPRATVTPKSSKASPPPHIIGQVVEMGFSPQQAIDALAKTSSGQDVAAAVEMLLSGERSSRRRDAEQSFQDERAERDRQYALRLQKEEHGQRNESRRRPGEGGAGASGDPSRTGTPVDWQKQADQLYAQASDLGATVFSRANALWTSAKTQAQKALDEHGVGAGMSSGQTSGRSSPGSASNERARSRRWAVPTRDGGSAAKQQQREWQGKPKWMLDAEAENEEESVERRASDTGRRGGAESSNAPSQSFRDDDDDGDVPEAPGFLDAPKAAAPVALQSSAVGESRQTSSRKDADLWSGRQESHQEAPARQQRSPLPNRSTPPVKQTKTSVAKQKPELRVRVLGQEDATAVKISGQHKERGNELFKRGAYGEAETAYSAALEALSAMPQSVRRIAILNNRANARIKNGDAKGSLDDTMAVLRLIVVQENERSSPFLLFRPSQEEVLPVPQYGDVNLREGYAKALLRRAQAEEMLERWDPALSVWSLLEKYEREEGSGRNGVTNMRAAQEGKGRCNKMLKGGDLDVQGTAQGAPRRDPRVRAAAAKAIAKAEAEAKQRIRAENAASEAEDAAKDRLRDSVDARILAWKTGKENNVRALLASLHDVVWPSLAWKRVGMHEVVMDNQVKKVYMRAIGKLHPDKLTPKNNTLEERMIGGAVFSVLNEAWAATQ